MLLLLLEVPRRVVSKGRERQQPQILLEETQGRAWRLQMGEHVCTPLRVILEESVLLHCAIHFADGVAHCNGVCYCLPEVPPQRRPLYSHNNLVGYIFQWIPK